MADFQKGDRVLTPGGPGSILYKRMAAPDFATVAAYSVDLDARSSHLDPSYSGTIYPAADVQPAPIALHCDMVKGCTAPITHIDHKGYIYCAQHGRERKGGGIRCRQLRPAELRALKAGTAEIIYGD